MIKEFPNLNFVASSIFGTETKPTNFRVRKGQKIIIIIIYQNITDNSIPKKTFENSDKLRNICISTFQSTELKATFYFPYIPQIYYFLSFHITDV